MTLQSVKGAGVAILVRTLCGMCARDRLNLCQFYDYLLTFTREVSLVWVARWNYMKVLFLLARYMPFFDGALHIYSKLSCVHRRGRPRLKKKHDQTVLFGTPLPKVVL
jgi:hypothetical protein